MRGAARDTRVRVFTTRGILLRRRRLACFYESRIFTRVNGLLKAVSSYIFGLKDA